MRSDGVQRKLTSAANIYIYIYVYMFKDNRAFCFPESSFGVISTKLYRAKAGTADLYKLNSSVCIYNIQFVFVVIFVSSVFPQSDLGASHSEGQRGSLSRYIGPADGAP